MSSDALPAEHRRATASGPGIARLLLQAAREFVDDAMPTYAAALAFRVLFSLFPFLIFLIALVGFLHVQALFDWLRLQAALVVPAQGLTVVNRVIDELEVPQGGVLSVGILLALWSSSAGVLAAMDAMNVAYKVKERRPLWKRVPLALLYTVAIALMLILAAGLMVTGPRFAAWVADLVGLRELFVTLWAWLRWPAAVLLLMLTVSLVYYVGPNVRQQRFRLLSPGAVVALVIWIGGSVGFGLYVRSFANYNATYGSLGAVVILLLFFFLSAGVLLFGAEVNAVFDRHRAAASGQRTAASDDPAAGP